MEEEGRKNLEEDDARNFDEYTQVLVGDTTNKMSFLGEEEGASLCIALLCIMNI
jgi:hypothetical protein